MIYGLRHNRFVIILAFTALIFMVTTPVSTAGDNEDSNSSPRKLAQISIKGSLPDALPPLNPFGPQPMYFKKLLNLIHQAAEDKEVAGIILKVDSPAIGFSKTRELNRAIGEFKDTGKKVFGYSEALSTKDLMIMSACDHLAVPESGLILIPGLNIEMMYYKKLFEKIGLKWLVEHVGDYKSAYENYSRDAMSEELREVLMCILDEFHASIVKTIAKNRGIDADLVTQAIDEAIISPDRAHELGLIDRVCYYDQFEDDIKARMKTKKLKIDKKYGRSDVDLDLNNPLVLFSQIMTNFTAMEKEDSKNPKIAVIYASGPIMSGKNQVDPFTGETTIGSDTLSKAILDAADDETVKAIVLRVDSPGGSGLASDIIWRAEMKAKKKKPFIVSMADVAGSGGYYIAMAADMIMAEPGTITGSIGVVSALPNLSGTLDKLGIRLERLSRGQNAGLMSIMAPPEDVNVKLIGRYMEDFYWKFVDKVAAGRDMTRDQIHKIAQGRVWTGRQAIENGLIDALGGLEDAIQVAKVKAGLTDEMNWEIKEMPEAPDIFDALSESLGLARSAAYLRKAMGIGPLESMLLDHPQIKARLTRLASIFTICHEDPILLLMPADIDVQF